MDLKEKLRNAGFHGEIKDDAATKDFFSHDASMFELKPKLVVMPESARDVETLVKFVADNKKELPDLSLTGRSAGTDMSGGAINDSIIVSFTQHMNKIVSVSDKKAVTQPGVLFRDLETKTLEQKAIMPSYPASKFLAAMGGIVNNNSGGEKSLQFGKTADWVRELKFVFADGVERVVKPLNKLELTKKMAQKDFEGKVYKEIFELCDKNYDIIKAAKPKVTKNSMGYGIWDVWNRDTGVFDLTRLIVGAQGTLGLTTEMTFELVHWQNNSGLLVLFLKDLKGLGELIPKVLKHKPATFECFDDATLLLTIKFMPYFLKMLGPKKFLKLLIDLLPDALQLLRGIPRMIVMVEFIGESEEEVREQVKALHRELRDKRARYEINGFEEAATEGKSEKFWIMRRHSFNLLRSKVKDKHTAPFIDDLIVPVDSLVQFLPKLRKLVKKYKLFATVQGHVGDGNFHIIPLMKIEDPKERAKLLPAMKEVNELVLKYGGSLSGEHNDGLVRGPWLERQFGKEVFGIFKRAKDIMDPSGIFNPHKKTSANWDYSFSHIREHF